MKVLKQVFSGVHSNILIFLYEKKKDIKALHGNSNSEKD